MFSRLPRMADFDCRSRCEINTLDLRTWIRCNSQMETRGWGFKSGNSRHYFHLEFCMMSFSYDIDCIGFILASFSIGDCLILRPKTGPNNWIWTVQKHSFLAIGNWRGRESLNLQPISQTADLALENYIAEKIDIFVKWIIVLLFPVSSTNKF